MWATIPSWTLRKHFWLCLKEFTHYISDAQMIQLPPQVYYLPCKVLLLQRRRGRGGTVPSQPPVITSAFHVVTFHLRYVRQLYVQPSLFRSSSERRREVDSSAGPGGLLAEKSAACTNSRRVITCWQRLDRTAQDRRGSLDKFSSPLSVICVRVWDAEQFAGEVGKPRVCRLLTEPWRSRMSGRDI